MLPDIFLEFEDTVYQLFLTVTDHPLLLKNKTYLYSSKFCDFLYEIRAELGLKNDIAVLFPTLNIGVDINYSFLDKITLQHFYQFHSAFVKDNTPFSLIMTQFPFHFRNRWNSLFLKSQKGGCQDDPITLSDSEGEENSSEKGGDRLMNRLVNMIVPDAAEGPGDGAENPEPTATESNASSSAHVEVVDEDENEDAEQPQPKRQKTGDEPQPPAPPSAENSGEGAGEEKKK
eukprot:GCRY01004289.1.p1 GENE.GCRY01004289.1~~GCRY01004289.1.p1  ORF type:complete len:231 (+),score=47.16 GCRY01004289.1:134-826(+)